MLIPLLALSLCGDIVDVDPGGQWSICYSITQDGPVSTYSGRAWLHGSSYPVPCMEYTFSIPAGDITGTCQRYDRYLQTQVKYPVLPFDTYTQVEGTLQGLWCAPSVLEPWQSTLINFEFSVLKTTYNADDLTEMLSDWGTDSPWDLDGSGIIDGADIALMLANWEAS